MVCERVKLVVELSSRCFLLAVIDTVLAQRIDQPRNHIFSSSHEYSGIIMFLLWWTLNMIVLLSAVVLFFQRRKQLIDTLCFIAAAFILYLSFAINEAFMHTYLVPPTDTSKYYNTTVVCCMQFGLGVLYILLRRHAQHQHYGIFSSYVFRHYLSAVYHLLFCLPAILHFIGISVTVMEWLPCILVAVTNLELLVTLGFRLPHIANTVEKNIRSFRQLLHHHGIQLVIESQWARLRIPTLLQTYWLCKIIIDFLLLVPEEDLNPEERYAPLKLYDVDISPQSNHPVLHFEGEGINVENNISEQQVDLHTTGLVMNTMQSVILKGCDGVVPLLGMTTMVSKLTHYLGMFLAFLVDSNNEEDKNMGTMCGILFFVLALQTGLTRLEPSKRLIRLYRNTCLLFTAILHFIHSMVHPILMSISATRTVSVWKHIRVLSMCLFLIVFPSSLLCYLWTRNAISPWLLAVTAFSIEVMIKVVISLLIYALFMVDSHQDTFWEELDDYIYYIKATGNTIEFLFGIFLFCNGAWIMVFESGGMIRAVMMCIHAYFNIWMQACEGWKVFIKRRMAVHKINSLPEATTEQLTQHNDICSICHETLDSARITKCRHMFHSVCLRKWLYHQDSCPMCHQSIFQTANQDETIQNNQQQQQHQQQQQQPGQVDHLHQD